MSDELNDILAEAQAEADSILDAAGGDAEEVLVDLSEAADFEPLPEGKGSGPNGMYLVQVTASQAGAGIKTKNGDPAWKLTFQVIDPAAARKAKIGRTVPLKGKGAGFVRDIASALGLPLDAERPALKPTAFIGRKAWAKVTLDTRDTPAKWNNLENMVVYSGAGTTDELVG